MNWPMAKLTELLTRLSTAGEPLGGTGKNPGLVTSDTNVANGRKLQGGYCRMPRPEGVDSPTDPPAAQTAAGKPSSSPETRVLCV